MPATITGRHYHNSSNMEDRPRELSTVERAAEIRAAYKAAGIVASIRSDYFGLGSSIDIRVRSGSFVKACEIAKRHENVRRDPGTGEILGGGNRYVAVDMDNATVNEKSARIMSAVQLALDVLHTKPEGDIERIGNSDLGLSRELTHNIKLWELGDNGKCVGFCGLSPECVAHHVALQLLKRV